MLRLSSFVLVPAAVLALAAPASAQDVFTSCPVGKVGLTYTGDEPTPTGRRLKGVHIVCGDTEVWADVMDVPSNPAEPIVATGQVAFLDQDFRVTAERATINRQTKLGTFDHFGGWARLTNRDIEKSQFGTMEPDVMFWGEKLERTGDRTYELTRGGFTTCLQPTRRWEVFGTKGRVTLDQRLILRNAVLRVKGVPLLYLPLIYYPLGDDDRSTGFLIPQYSTGNFTGTGLRNAFFWAINRSQDATLYHDWFAKSGQKYGGEYRYVAAPGSDGNLTFLLFNEKAQFGSDGETEIRPASRSFELQGTMSQGLPRGFRLVARSNYAQDLVTRQLYNQNVYDFSNRERYFGGTLTGAFGRYRILANVEQRDYFYGLETAQRRGNTPRVSIAMSDKPIGRSRVYFGVGGEVLHLVDQFDLNDPETNRSFWKLNAAPALRVPISTLPYLQVTTAAQWQLTRWFESQDPETGAQVPTPLTRSLLRLQARLTGPLFSRTWQPQSSYADRIKHLIEPSLTFDWTSAFSEFDRVPVVDGDRQVGGTTTVTYGLTNRILARKPSPTPGGRGVSRDILSVSLSQSYYTNSLAAAFDSQYQSAQSATKFSPLRINVNATPADQFTASFNVDIDPTFKTPRVFGASGTLRSRRVDVNGNWSKRQFIPGLPGFDNEAFASHALGANTTIRTASNKAGGSYGMNFDLKTRTFVQQRIVAYYNAQCCGISADYQSVSFANFGFQIPTDRRLTISFTLAGIGTFAPPFTAFGDNSGRR